MPLGISTTAQPMLAARMKVDELLAGGSAPPNQMLSGPFSAQPVRRAWRLAGRALVSMPFEAMGDLAPGAVVVERVELEIWWMDSKLKRSFALRRNQTGHDPSAGFSMRRQAGFTLIEMLIAINGSNT